MYTYVLRHNVLFPFDFVVPAMSGMGLPNFFHSVVCPMEEVETVVKYAHVHRQIWAIQSAYISILVITWQDCIFEIESAVR